MRTQAAVPRWWGIQWLFPASLLPFILLVLLPLVDRKEERTPAAAGRPWSSASSWASPSS